MFSKKPAGQPRQLPARPPARAPMAGATFSVLGADTAIKGDVSASSDLHIDGKIEGDVVCTALVQGESSEITGAVKAETAKLAGIVRGTITVGELVIVRSARIHGDVAYESLTIEPGAQVDGRLSTRNTLVVEPANTADDNSEPLLTLASSAS
jgi:cytoskeletal protein CcmA (bactofilin family)